MSRSPPSQRPEDLVAMMEKVFRLGLEGLVLKDLEVSDNIYSPDKICHYLSHRCDIALRGKVLLKFLLKERV